MPPLLRHLRHCAITRHIYADADVTPPMIRLMLMLMLTPDI